ncbi:MAG: hypothetical protein WCR20_05445, partial [Verrucomicrobiota bacterium]
VCGEIGGDDEGGRLHGKRRAREGRKDERWDGRRCMPWQLVLNGCFLHMVDQSGALELLFGVWFSELQVSILSGLARVTIIHRSVFW